MAQLGNLIVNGVTRLLSKLYVSDSVTAPTFIGKLTGNADSATKLSSSAGSATQPVYFSDGKPVATTYTLGKSVPADAKFTDTNTWRGVQNNLTSTATDQSLSAAQGKVLKDLVDGKADNSEAGANGLLAKLPTTWSAAPTDDTYFIRQDTSGINVFGRLKFSTLWSYIKGKSDTVYQAKGSYAAASHTHTKSQITDFPTLGDASSKTVRTLSSQGSSGWSNKDTDDKYVPTMSFIAYWNGSYGGSASNLAYCNKGAFGTAATKNTGDFAAASHSHSAFGKATADAAGSAGFVPAPAKGQQGLYLRGDGSWATPTNTTYSNMKAATSSAAGSAGLVPAPAAGAQAKYLRGDGTWQTPTNTTYSNMTAATATADGKAGLVPAPGAGKQGQYLRGDGTWATPTNTTYGAASQSAAGLMSADDKKKLDGVATGANAYSLPTATGSVLGGVKTGSNITNSSGTISLTKANVTNALGYTPPTSATVVKIVKWG